MYKRGDKKLINAWAFYDWANSVYSLVISTAVFPLYYSAVTKGKTVRFLGMDWEHPDSLYSYALSFSFLVVAFISPILSGIADYTGSKKKFMKFFCWMGGLSVIALYFFKGVDTVWIGILFTILASIGFWASWVFYNAYLPEVALPEQQDKASAKGFMYGYVGSVILLIINLILIQKPDLFGITTGMASRISFVMVGLWWIGFAQITFKKLPDDIYNKQPDNDYIWKGYRELKIVYKELLNYPTLKRFLISFFFLSIGVQTIILMAAIFGSSELNLPTFNMILTILLVQIIAIFGAYIFSRISGKFGNITALKITIIIWMLVCLFAFSLDKTQENVGIYFYGLGGLLGLVQGAIQTLTRSTYSKLLPDTQDHATYFSFYDVTEKIAIVLGTSVYGTLYAITDSMQWSVLCLAVFFLASLLVLSTMKKTKYVA
ncbi:MFS transporter [Tenacibaculum finnmarkense genomovar finnmarkense]|uniref:MFS transporter n=2 Tax=Tenacibaculum finnmarkense TaxID=2781243 RepID=UPI00187BB167|nr:MFS transporter [Tenacibaculum finnmarkense]MBE7692762.1 MFS transporter [Tenacibaculum finnmarkense genomovar finnmarkense]MCD8402832.1 MFS transporter [Tenacibaculum finnmarkense genomovar finnmarkense]MCD8418288.1 MFS transporter [Tenacibaculum finnmarkense genomovar finnmarkense]MCD8439432.1 MFS transporter [Tenacibaculum finnmarkense genomovar ulcerans]MCD8447198.1 MFS transporter [Tenacibaculum finnmarkense genomovar finnmarkense]